MTSVDRNETHYLSGRSLGGGIAYLPGLCQNNYNYALSSHLNGSFPLPLQNNRTQNWDPMVFCHELGHNFNAPHSHCMSPPIDTCAGLNYDCPNPQVCINTGTIMSYCHLCSGGVGNVRMEFHQRTINESMLPYLTNSVPCDPSVSCGLVGDCDGDGNVDMNDIPCFTDILLGVNTNLQQAARCDMNADDLQDGQDIEAFVQTILDE